MEVKIERISKDSSENTIVWFSSIYGNAKALWHGDKPGLGVKCFVEFEVSDCVWEDNVTIFDAKKIEIGMEGEQIYFIGILESVDDDGYSVIRIGTSIIGVMISGTPFATGIFVKVRPEQVKLYDYNY